MLVQQSFALVAPIAQQAGALFTIARSTWTRICVVCSQVTSANRVQKLMQMLAVAVRSLDDIGSITRLCTRFGRAHVAYGVTAQHFDTVANALPKIEHMRL